MSPARQAPFIVWLAALALALTFAAGALRPAPSAAAQAAVTVTIGARLSPPTVTIPPGATVTWRNADREEHRIRSSTGPIQFDSGDLDANQAFAFTFTVAGTFDYHDDRNRSDSNYFGQVIVSSSPPPSPGTGGGGGTAPPPPPSSASARIVDYGYEPAQLIVAVGATITWTNAGQAKHTVTATGGAFDSGILDTGGTYSRTFTAAGAFSYFCDLHPSMTASVSVAEPGKPPPPPPAAPPAPPAPPPAPGGGSGGGGPAAPGSVSALDYSFSPATFQVTPGTTVTWVNNGAAPHTVTAGDGSFDSGTMRPGAAYSRTFSAAGNYGYFCALHPGMTGSVTVTATPSNPPGGVNPGNPGSLPPNLPGGAAPPALPSAPGEVSAADYDFLPGTLTITPGSKVTWKFTGVAPHTVTANDGSFDSGILKNGSTYVRTFPTPGTFAYFCAIHPNMTGLVQVALPGTTAPPPAPGSAPRPASAATSGDVGMFDFEFAPASIAIAAGGTVTWGNRGIAPHTVTARDGSFDSGIVAAGGVFSRRFPTAGTYAYICTLHPNMTGVVVVRASDGSAPPPAVQARENAAPAPASAGPVELSLEMIDFDYSPQSVTVAPGSKLSWKNTGVAPHTVTSPNGAFDSGPKKSGESWTHTFERPGTYAYYCIFHENMKGVVIVAAPGEASGAGPTVGADRTAPQATRPSSAGASSGTIWIAALAVTLGAVAVTFAAGGVALMARAGRREDASIG